MNHSPTSAVLAGTSSWTFTASSSGRGSCSDRKGDDAVQDATAALAYAIELNFSTMYASGKLTPDPQQASRDLVKLLDLETGHLDLTAMATSKSLAYLVEHLSTPCWLALDLVADVGGAAIKTVSLPSGGLGPGAMAHFAQMPGVTGIRLSAHHGADLSALAAPYAEYGWDLPTLTLHDTQPFITLVVPHGMKLRCEDAQVPVVHVRTVDASGDQDEWTLSYLLHAQADPAAQDCGDSPGLPSQALSPVPSGTRKRKQPA